MSRCLIFLTGNFGDTRSTVMIYENLDPDLSQMRGAGASVFIALLDDQSKRPVALKGEAFPGFISISS